MAEVGGSPRRRAPALLEGARARCESPHIWDDVFGESSPESGGNPFYSTSAASRSSSAAASDDEQERPGPPPPPGAPEAQESDEDEASAGWSATLRGRPPMRFEDSGAQVEGEDEREARSALSKEPDAGLDPRTLDRCCTEGATQTPF
ncbi:piggyBac transposable element-derived protein 5-like [Mustela lutreola]|uniref:piggyBac transposable element-derived protein 5-like n=1 Tax=Mustela lutreola TaxID=9666 RepID=UPI00279797F0|nr:piggyBac transposable element-derived protein 5-like [Mustela lutreola]XP_059036067.1 piggyBac transposable element-derived protein 5-like [Mustela lutreola]XP_059036068.1 piggyBac transposable element-derived protein 5-like [Mustela lutreola]